MGVVITSLEAEQFKRLKAVRLEPGAEGLTVIGGKNGQGKTSVLDAVAYALGGAKFKPSEAKNRESGEEEAHIRVELSNGLVAERKGANGSLKVTDATGLKGTQGVLDEILEALALDLPKFMEGSGKQKADTLLQIIGAGEKLAVLDGREKKIYQARRDVGKVADTLEKALKGMEHTEDIHMQPVSTLEIQEEMERAEITRTERDTLLERKAEYVRQIEYYKEQLSEYEAGLKQDIEPDLAAIEVPETSELTDRLAEAEETNRRVKANTLYIEKKGEAKSQRDLHTRLGKDLDTVRASRQKLLAEADMPLPELSVVDGELEYKGAKWDCMSSSEQLKVATAIVRKLNPECAFVLIDKLERMDLDTLKEFGKWAKAEGLQILATRVSTGDECSVVIEDGQVV